MRFFVAKVNLDRMPLLRNGYLRLLQVRYEAAKFMLPLRLGTVNAEGAQDLIVYTLTRNGRVETANYRTVKLPSNVNIPLYVKGEFGRFYKARTCSRVAAACGRTSKGIERSVCERDACPPIHTTECCCRLTRCLETRRDGRALPSARATPD
jgi:hypothetical protein